MPTMQLGSSTDLSDHSPPTVCDDAPRGAWLNELTPTATLEHLPSFETTASPDTLTILLDQQFHSSPDLPGVIIASESQLLGLVSREMLLGQLSRPFGIELYLKRPVRLLLEAEQQQPLVLPVKCSVGEAAGRALGRPTSQVYEPIVVWDGKRFRLIDVHTLLIAQSQLLKLANLTVQQQMDSAEAANRAKSQFLANMSHEIRTPLTAILGFTENLLEPQVPEVERTAALQTILRNGHHLLQLINDILDLSKIEADRMTLEQKDFSLSQTIDSVISMQGSGVTVKGLSLSREIDPTLPDVLRGDALRVKQILINFTGNAIKFSERGKITVRAKALEKESTSVLLRIEVTDQGIGISPEDQKRLFHAFTQVDESMTRKSGGTGLGLIISKRMALLMGGDAGVESEVGVGSTFWFTARLATKGGPAVEAEHAMISSDATTLKERYFAHRILVVDDEPINREVVQIQLDALDLIVDTAEDGAEAVAKASAGLYAAIFMDMQMPKLNGLDATRQIRQIPEYKHVPIIAMTANVFDEDKAQCLAAGMDGFLSKPFTPNELFGTLLRSLE